MGTNDSRIARALTKVNVARTISDHLLGECHPIKHRMWVGVSLMAIGVLVSKVMQSNPYVHLLFDGLGYLIHGAGAIPFIDWFGRERKEQVDNNIPVTSGVKEVSDVVANT